MPSTNYSTVTNRLLTAMPRKLGQHFLADCELVNLSLAQILMEPDEPIRYVYFPTESFISLVMPFDTHANLELGMVGDEGMLGTPLILGVDVSPMRATVQGAGQALRMKSAVFKHQLEQNPALRRVLKRYLYVVMRQLAQTSTCMYFHVVETRLARWLLMTQDRAHSDAFHITHKLLADILGVRRVGVTKAATSLQNRELIRYNRGDIMVIDRDGLEAASCGCYKTDTAIYTRVMGKKKTK